MPSQPTMNEDAIEHLRALKNESEEILSELIDIFPPNYRFTFVARNLDNLAGADVILTNDEVGDVLRTLEREGENMETKGSDDESDAEGDEGQ